MIDPIALADDLIVRAQALRAALTPASVPVTPAAITDRLVRPKPAPIALGPAGFTFSDPTFGSTIARVTDEHTAEANSPCRLPSNEAVSPWSSDGLHFYVIDQWVNPLVFDLVNGVPQRHPLKNLRGSNVEPTFSYSDPDHLWIVAPGAPQHRLVQRFSISADAIVDTIIDLDQAYPALSLANTYIGGLHTADGDAWVVFFGGAGQDAHHYLHHSAAGFLDTQKQPVPFFIHAAGSDRTGRFIVIYPRGSDVAAVAPAVIWDTQSGALTPVKQLAGGHWSLGYGVAINADCCTQSTWDALQWQIRSLAAPAVTGDLVAVLEPKQTGRSDHTSWRGATPTGSVPILSSTFRYADGLAAPWRAWDDEILAIATDGSGTVQRFAHHQSIVTTDFWTQPLLAADPTGRYVLFSTNWGQTIGADRQDVLLCTLR